MGRAWHYIFREMNDVSVLQGSTNVMTTQNLIRPIAVFQSDKRYLEQGDDLPSSHKCFNKIDGISCSGCSSIDVHAHPWPCQKRLNSKHGPIDNFFN